MKSLNQNTLNATLDYIKRYQIGNGKSPSYREIMKEMHFNNLATVFRYVNRLYSNGLLEKDRLGGIEIPTNLRTDETIIAPLVGNVACGSPILAEQNIERTYQLPVDLFGRADLKILNAKGDSMIEVGIFDGDWIFYHPCNSANDGDIVVALIDDEATVKRYFKKKNKIILHPENQQYEDIIVDDCKIQGIVKRTVHKL